MIFEEALKAMREGKIVTLPNRQKPIRIIYNRVFLVVETPFGHTFKPLNEIKTKEIFAEDWFIDEAATLMHEATTNFVKKIFEVSDE